MRTILAAAALLAACGGSSAEGSGATSPGDDGAKVSTKLCKDPAVVAGEGTVLEAPAPAPAAKEDEEEGASDPISYGQPVTAGERSYVSFYECPMEEDGCRGGVRVSNAAGKFERDVILGGFEEAYEGVEFGPTVAADMNGDGVQELWVEYSVQVMVDVGDFRQHRYLALVSLPAGDVVFDELLYEGNEAINNCDGYSIASVDVTCDGRDDLVVKRCRGMGEQEDPASVPEHVTRAYVFEPSAGKYVVREKTSRPDPGKLR